MILKKNIEKDVKDQFKSGDILVVPEISKNIIGILKEASGIIIESDITDSMVKDLKSFSDKPIIFGAKNATSLLHLFRFCKHKD